MRRLVFLALILVSTSGLISAEPASAAPCETGIWQQVEQMLISTWDRVTGVVRSTPAQPPGVTTVTDAYGGQIDPLGKGDPDSPATNPSTENEPKPEEESPSDEYGGLIDPLG